MDNIQSYGLNTKPWYIKTDSCPVLTSAKVQQFLKENEIKAIIGSAQFSNQLSGALNRTIRHYLLDRIFPGYKDNLHYKRFALAKRNKRTLTGLVWKDPFLTPIKTEQSVQLIYQVVNYYNNKPHQAFKSLLYKGKKGVISPNIMYRSLI